MNWKMYTVIVLYKTGKQGNIIIENICLLYNIAVSWQRVKVILCRDMKVVIALKTKLLLGMKMVSTKTIF